MAKKAKAAGAKPGKKKASKSKPVKKEAKKGGSKKPLGGPPTGMETR